MSDRARKIYEMIDQKVKQFGHMVLMTPCPLTASMMSYSIGLSPKYGFEILTMGMSGENAQQAINSIVRSMAAGLQLETGKIYGTEYKWVTGPIKFEVCDPEDPVLWTNCVVQVEHYYGKRPPVWQMVLSDKEDRFPEDPLYDRMYMDDLQVCMYKPNKSGS